MKKYLIRVISLLLALSLTCPVPAQAEGLLSLITDLFTQVSTGTVPVTPYSEMEYVRPDLEQMQQLLDEVCSLAEGKDAFAILDGVFKFYDAYDWFYTACALANIRYCGDLTDSYWEEENDFCTAATPTVQQMLDILYTALAQSPCRRKLEKEFFGDGFFDDYDSEFQDGGDGFYDDYNSESPEGGDGYFDGYDTESFWDDELISLLEQENQLINQYYTQSSRFGTLLGSLFPPLEDMAQTLVDLIEVRNQMAACVGYDSYEAFANDFYYYRDYDPKDMSAYLDEIRDTLAPLYSQIWEGVEMPEDCDTDWAMDYMRQAAQAMGGKIQASFQLMEDAGLYDIRYSRKKFDSSFEIYLPSYYEPFLFMNPSGTTIDALTLAHEFGHFCNDDASFGTIVGIDVSEVFSQGMEYLSLIYAPEAQALTRYKMADSLSVYVEQACYARFEQEMYLLPQPSVEALCELYEQIASEYGLIDEYYSAWDFVTVPHYYTNPMYISSYIISNDAALQLYQLECDSPGEGLKLYQQNLDTEQPYFLAFLEEAGLESPFAPGRLEEVAEAFRQFISAA